MNLAEIRQRIVSISQTRQITQAMRMISSAKMRQGLKRATANDYLSNPSEPPSAPC